VIDFFHNNQAISWTVFSILMLISASSLPQFPPS
jgi:hypothetical protein